MPGLAPSLCYNLIATLLFIIVIFTIQFYWRRRRLYELARKIPGPEGLPIFGELLTFMKLDAKEFFPTTVRLMDDNATITKVWVGSILVLLTDHPDTVHTILNSPHCQNKPPLFYHPLDATNGLLPLSGELYAKHRKVLKKAFMPGVLVQIQPIIDLTTKGLIEELKSVLGKEVNIIDYVGACALETFGRAQLNRANTFYGSDDLRLVERSMELAMDRITRPWFHFLPDFLKNMTDIGKESLQFKQVGKSLQETAEEICKDMSVKDFEAIQNRIIGLLLDPKNNFSDTEIRDELMIFVIASYDTTAKTASVMLLLLALHPEIQKKLIAEVDEICSHDENFTMNADFHKKFVYMEAVIKESLRLFPPGPNFGRINDEEIEAGGYTIPKGSSILVPVIKMHRNPKHWGSDAHLFKPERFLNDDWNPRAFAPFSGGKRTCIGMRYAYMFLKTLFIYFFRAYKVESSLKFEQLTYTTGVTLNMDQGYMLTVKKRNDFLCK